MKFLILENIRGAYNVGAIFRTADGAGVDKIYLIGYTPAPIDRFGRLQPTIMKTSLGASDEVAWEQHESIDKLLTELKEQAVKIVAVEQKENSVTLADFKEPDNVAYVIGNEIEGVSPKALEAADTIVEIPMLGTKESLNLSVAAGVVLYHGLTSNSK